MAHSVLKISALLKKQSPVFIVGAPRSGTTLLFRILQRHSSFTPRKYRPEVQIYCPAKFGLSESKVFLYPFKTYSAENDNAYAYMLCDDTAYRRFLASTQWVQKYQINLRMKFISRKVQARSDRIRSLAFRFTLSHYLIRAYFYYAKRARGMQRILEKSPHVTRIPEIKTTFPEAKLLFIYRHPVDVFGSYRRRVKTSLESGISPSSLAWLQISAEEFCNIYSNAIKLALTEEKSSPDGFMAIRYEDFTANPRTQMHRILAFLGESYQEECLSEDRDERPTWSMDPYLFANIRKVTKNWEDFISEAEAQLIEERLHETMLGLNYPRYTSAA